MMTLSETHVAIVETLDDDDDILLALAQELGMYIYIYIPSESLDISSLTIDSSLLTLSLVGEFVELVGGAMNAHHLLFLLETLVAVDEASVRDMVHCPSGLHDIYLSISISIYLSIYIYIYLSIYLYLYR